MDSGENAKNTELQTAFIPLPIQLAGANSQAATSNICVEIPHQLDTAKVNWPTESAAASATFLRNLSR